jgi:hypothetical protein
MKSILIRYFSILSILLLAFSCSEDIMDEIDTDPNNPVDVPINMLIPNVTIAVPFNVTGTDIAWYSSIFVEQTAGVHGQMRDADRRASINSQLGENAWAYFFYPDIFMDLKQIIIKGSEGGSEEGNWHNVGVAQVLLAYSMFVTTDTWGRVPWTEAFLGSDNRYPTYDNQESIYQDMQEMLDDAIANFQKESTASPAGEDFIYGGDLDAWTRAAYALKARYHNRLSNIDATGSAADALAAIGNAFTSSADDFTFDNWGADGSFRNPWYRMELERGHHALSQTLYDLMNANNDPRLALWFTQIDGAYAPALNGTAAEDQSHTQYSPLSGSLVYNTAPLPIMTYDEMKFIEAECHLRKASPDADAALAAYTEALDAALIRAGVDSTGRADFKSSTAVVPADASGLTLDMIITQKYLALFPYGSIEAYAEWRRTGIPAMQNPLANTPRRFPYPQNEISGNGENVPDVTVNDGVWWDDGTED